MSLKVTEARDDCLRSILDARAVVMLRLRDHSHTVEIGEMLVDAGLRVMEVTLDHADSAYALQGLCSELGDRAMIGAGTVKTRQHVQVAAAAGARFCVSPHMDPAVVAATAQAGMEPLPGACAPTEVAIAEDCGARLVKLFPAGPLGPNYLQAMRGPFPSIGFVPTGGVRHDDLKPWFAAGAVAVGLGSDLIGEADLPTMRQRADQVVAQLQDLDTR